MIHNETDRLHVGFEIKRMNVYVCRNCNEIDRIDGNIATRGKCWHCGNKFKVGDGIRKKTKKKIQ